MKIVGCDLHARQQTIAMVDTETGEFLENTFSRLNSSQCSISFPSSVLIENASDWLLDAHDQA